MDRFFDWSKAAEASAGKEILRRIGSKKSQSNSALYESQFLTSKNLTLCKPDTELVRSFLRAFLAAYMDEMRNGRNQELFVHVSCNRNFPVAPLHCTYLLQLVFDNGKTEAKVPFKMILPTAFEEKALFSLKSFDERRSWKQEAEQQLECCK